MGRARLAELHGVATSYEPAPGRTVQVPEDTVVAVLAALGVDASTPRSVKDALDRHERRQRDRLLPPCVVLRPGGTPRQALPDGLAEALPDGTELRVRTEDGAPRGWGPAAAARPLLPPGTGVPLGTEPLGTGSLTDTPLPLGTHTLTARAPDGRTATAALIVAPDRMPSPPARSHGFLVQLYSLLSARSWGMGDLGDLADLAAWSGRAFGTGFIQLNPLHSAVPGTPAAPTDPSPYRPS
uniref:4-alpha-glucanotransferase n=1 Tax=Streptomyces sp. NEAU-S77 TaxID=3411033 RepID=UPI003BA376DF